MTEPYRVPFQRNEPIESIFVCVQLDYDDAQRYADSTHFHPAWKNDLESGDHPHITLGYYKVLGPDGRDPMYEIDQFIASTIFDIATIRPIREDKVLTSGVGIFSDHGDGYPIVALINSKFMQRLNQIVDTRMKRSRLPVQFSEYSYTPHMTLCYSEIGDISVNKMATEERYIGLERIAFFINKTFVGQAPLRFESVRYPVMIDD